MTTLTITVGESLAEGFRDLANTMQAVSDGREVSPQFGLGFQNMAQMGEVFSPKRWELVEVLKQTGPQSIYALAKRLDRHYRNVHQDVTKLSEWMVIEKDESGKVFVPWDKIDVQWPLERLAA
jgi:predicted transcriptional regulator